MRQVQVYDEFFTYEEIVEEFMERKAKCGTIILYPTKDGIGIVYHDAEKN